AFSCRRVVPQLVRSVRPSSTLRSMNDHREPGKIILINGASSAGKSTLARSLQQQLPEPFLHWSFDHLRESNALPMVRIRNGELDWARLRPAVFDGFHRCLPAFAQAGNNLIVDHIIEQEQWLADLVELLAPFDVFFVGVHCPCQSWSVGNGNGVTGAPERLARTFTPCIVSRSTISPLMQLSRTRATWQG